MTQKAAYYHFVLHPAFQTDVFTHTKYYYTSSSVQVESSISHYKLNNNYRPHCNITKNSTSICRSSITDNICVVARANMLEKPVLLVAKTTNVFSSVFVTFVPGLALVIISVVIVLAFIVWRNHLCSKLLMKFLHYEPLINTKDNESEIEGQFTRQDESEEQPGSALAQEGQLARDSQQSDELATEDESTKQDDQ
ncbi:PREDICTED: uncharacterized protein LOC109588498, partial [Amphimedon queenslandica]|uniref:Uncharacterized protein n=1 Tax=Amphimedon queenslandica TaxID=400682 RepID=A0AAN0JT44_AMPQE